MSSQKSILDNTPITIECNGEKFLIAIANGEMVNVNQLHVASGKKSNQSPAQWLRLPATINLLKPIANRYNVEESHIIKTKRGKGGYTMVHWQLALAYAKYLSPEIHLQVNQVFKERTEEIIDPTLSYERGKQRAIDSWQRRGKDNEWIAARLNGIETRNYFTDTLAKHGTKGKQFAQISDIENQAVLGCTAKQYKTKRQLAKSARTRDHLNRSDVIALELLESVSIDKIKGEQSQNGKQCRDVVTRVSSVMSDAYRKMMSA
jgi:hypothetical protein